MSAREAMANHQQRRAPVPIQTNAKTKDCKLGSPKPQGHSCFTLIWNYVPYFFWCFLFQLFVAMAAKSTD